MRLEIIRFLELFSHDPVIVYFAIDSQGERAVIVDQWLRARILRGVSERIIYMLSIYLPTPTMLNLS